jgi:hypothetical protein
MPETVYGLTETWKARLEKLWRKSRNTRISGPGVTCSNSEESLTVSIQPTAEQSVTRAENTIRLKLTSAVSGQPGVYNAKSAIGVSSVPASGAVTEASFSDAWAAADDLLVINPPDIGASAHSIDPSNAAQAVRVGVVVSHHSSGKRVVMLTSGGGASQLGELAPLSTLGGNTEGSEAANTTTWEQGTNALDLWVLCRGAYFDAGDQKLYGYARKITIDTLGNIRAVGGETRYEMDVPEEGP